MAIGGAIGVGTTTAVSLASGANPITVNFILKGLGAKKGSYDFTLDPNGDNITLYRGIIGKENKRSFLFMTDYSEYAATYAKNGGQVVEIKMSRSTFFEMTQRGDISPLNGEYFNFAGKEYQIKARVVPEFIKQFKPDVP